VQNMIRVDKNVREEIISMPAVFCRHLVGKTQRNVYDCGIA